MTTNTTPTTEDHQDPQTHPDFRQRHNPNAWRDCSVPPTPQNDRSNPHFRSWRMHECPVDAGPFYFDRAKGLLTFLRCMLASWGQQAYSANMPTLELGYDDVQGLIQVVDTVGENLDLAMNATRAATKDTTPSV